MKVKIKTPLIKFTINEETLIVNGYIKHGVDGLSTIIKCAIDNALRLHEEVAKTNNQ
jgi:hypothetical protein